MSASVKAPSGYSVCEKHEEKEAVFEKRIGRTNCQQGEMNEVGKEAQASMIRTEYALSLEYFISWRV